MLKFEPGSVPRPRRTCTAAWSWPIVSWIGKAERGRRVRFGVGAFCYEVGEGMVRCGGLGGGWFRM